MSVSKGYYNRVQQLLRRVNKDAKLDAAALAPEANGSSFLVLIETYVWWDIYISKRCYTRIKFILQFSVKIKTYVWTDTSAKAITTEYSLS